MGFKLTERVFELDRKQTTATEQAVLVALAFRANDATLECRPKQETLAQMTHLSRVTVCLTLNSLKEKGFLTWVQGGLKKNKGRYGQTLSNVYQFDLSKLPMSKSLQKAKNDELFGEPSVKQLNTPVLSSLTPQCKAALHTSVNQLNTPVLSSLTPTEDTTDIHHRYGTEASLPGLDVCSDNETVSRQTSDTSRNVPKVLTSWDREDPAQLALTLAGVERGTQEATDNMRAYSSVILKLGISSSFDCLYQIESELRQGELKHIKNMPAFIMSRLKERLNY